MAPRLPGSPLKRWLVIVLLLGVISFSGSGGTFASFNAQISNPGSTIASGTLTLSNEINNNSATACLSSGTGTYPGTPLGNVNNNCDSIFSLANLEPGSWSSSTQTATVALENTGSLGASNLVLEAPSTTDCYDAQTSAAPSGFSGATFGTQTNFDSVAINATAVSLVSSSTTVTGVANEFTNVKANMIVTGTGVPANDYVASTPGAASTFTLHVAASATETSETLEFTAVSTANVTLALNSTTATTGGNFTTEGVSVGMAITGTGVGPGAVVTAVTATSLTMSEAATAAETSDTLTFGGNPFCSSALMYVQEQSGGNYFCWYGYGTTGANGAANVSAGEASTDGLCDAPVVDTLSSNVSGSSITSIPFSSLSGPIFTNDVLTISGGGNSLQVCATGGPYPAQTGLIAIPVETYTGSACQAGAATAGANTYTTAASTVVDTTENGHLNGDPSADTIANFDTYWASGTGSIALYPINGVGTVNTSASTDIAALATRTFTIGVYLPNTANNQNYLQGLQSTFGVTWYVSQ